MPFTGHMGVKTACVISLEIRGGSNAPYFLLLNFLDLDRDTDATNECCDASPTGVTTLLISITEGGSVNSNNAIQNIYRHEPRRVWLRGVDLNHRPLGYEPNELPDCSTPRIHTSNHDLRRSNSRENTDFGCTECSGDLGLNACR